MLREACKPRMLPQAETWHPAPRDGAPGRAEVSKMASAKDVLRNIPAVDQLLGDLEAEEAAAPRSVVVDAVRAAVEGARESLLAEPEEEITEAALREAILADARTRIRSWVQPHYRKVINATGIILPASSSASCR